MHQTTNVCPCGGCYAAGMYTASWRTSDAALLANTAAYICCSSLCVTFVSRAEPATALPICEPSDNSGVRVLLAYPPLMRLLPVLKAADDSRSRCPISEIIEVRSVSELTLPCDSLSKDGSGRMLLARKDSMGFGVLSLPSSSNTCYTACRVATVTPSQHGKSMYDSHIAGSMYWCTVWKTSASYTVYVASREQVCYVLQHAYPVVSCTLCCSAT